ncbi:MAG: sensor histidine kinase [Bacillota bacterium]|nr:sensor histidine kinase [Bacillota bacterium]
MKVFVSDIATGLALVLAAVFLLLSQNLPVQDIVLSGAVVIILVMATLFFNTNQNPKSSLLIRLIILFVFAIFLYGNTLFIYFLPALSYSMDMEKEPWIAVLSGFFLYAVILNINILLLFSVLIICLLAMMLTGFKRRYLVLEEASYSEIDRLRHINEKIRLEQKNLISLQNSAVKEGRDEERRRISSEIHDNLGHDLSASIIQLAAMEYQIEDPCLQKQIRTVRDLLSSGMNNVRAAIHHEHNEALDLRAELERQAQAFTKARIKLSLDFRTDPGVHLKHTIINIVKEALANINKHSNASRVSITFREGSSGWALLIVDNGTDVEPNPQNPGIGLLTMEERVHAHGGSLIISKEKGFRIFIKFPYEEGHA